MSKKIVNLDPTKVNPTTLLAQIAEREGLEAVVAVVRVDGYWHVAWSSDVDNGGLSMAALKLMFDVSRALHGDYSSPWTPPPEKEPA